MLDLAVGSLVSKVFLAEQVWLLLTPLNTQKGRMPAIVDSSLVH